jgi:photosystem II stability/assembly factor-like uncharacterized protein
MTPVNCRIRQAIRATASYAKRSMIIARRATESSASLVIDSVNTNTIYAGELLKGIFKSTDGGDTWKEISTELPGYFVQSLAIDPKNTGTIYAGTFGIGVFKSTDSGSNWTDFNNGLTGLKVLSIAINPKKTNTIYAGTYGSGICKSTDGGNKWISKGLTGGVISSLVIDPTNADTIYVGTWMDGMFKSTDGGGTRTAINKGLPGYIVWSLAIDPKSTNTVYAGVVSDYAGGVYKSTDGGMSWTAFNNGLAGSHILSLAIDQKNTSTIYAGADNGVYKSTDGGMNWTAVNNGLTGEDFWALAIDPANTSTIYAGTRNVEGKSTGVFKSTNGCSNWTDINKGLTNLEVWSLVVDPTDTSIIYAGTLFGVFKYGCSSVPTPSAPQNLLISASINSINLNWSSSTQGTYPLAGYAVYRGTASGAEDTTPTAKVDASTITYTDTNVTFDTAYYYYVKAYDDQDPANYSDSSNEVNAKIVDTTPPDISISYPADYTTLDTDSVYISGKATDAQSGIDKVTVNGIAVSLSSDGSFSKTVTLSEGLNRITIIAIDKAGNQETKILSITYKKPVQTIVIVLQIGQTSFTVNGVSNTLDSPPVIKNNRTLLPIRAIIESLGGTVSWDATERKVTVSLGSKTIELWIGKNTAKVNGVDTPIDSSNSKVVPEIINSRTMLPLRFVAENVGATVDWDGTTKTITITYQAP